MYPQMVHYADIRALPKISLNANKTRLWLEELIGRGPDECEWEDELVERGTQDLEDRVASKLARCEAVCIHELLFESLACCHISDATVNHS